MEPEAPSVLVVDDDEEYLSYMGAALTRAGYSSLLAGSAQAALRAIESGSFSLIITDLRLPASSGMEVLKAARERDPVAVVIVMTAYGTLDAALEALRQGAYDFMLKPCAADVLQATIRRAFEHYALRRQLLERTAELERLREEYQSTSQLLEQVSQQLEAPLTAENAEQMLRLLQRLARSAGN